MVADLRRRRVLLAAGTTIAAGLAGCGGDGDDPTEAAEPTDSGDPTDDGTGPADTPTATATADDSEQTTAEQSESTTGGESGGTPTPATERGPMGTLVTDRIDEIEFVGWRADAGDFGTFTVYMHVENAGNEPFEAGDYTWGIVPYAEDGAEISVSASGPVNTEYEGALPAGERGEVSYHVRVDDANAVAAYDIHLSCEGSRDDGAYCPS